MTRAALLLAAPAQARSVPRGWLGVQADGPLTAAGNPFASEWSLMAASGAESVRAAFDWRAAQPTADGPIDFGPTDAVVAANTSSDRQSGHRSPPSSGSSPAKMSRWVTRV